MPRTHDGHRLVNHHTSQQWNVDGCRADSKCNAIKKAATTRVTVMLSRRSCKINVLSLYVSSLRLSNCEMAASKDYKQAAKYDESLQKTGKTGESGDHLRDTDAQQRDVEIVRRKTTRCVSNRSRCVSSGNAKDRTAYKIIRSNGCYR